MQELRRLVNEVQTSAQASLRHGLKSRDPRAIVTGKQWQTVQLLALLEALNFPTESFSEAHSGRYSLDFFDLVKAGDLHSFKQPGRQYGPDQAVSDHGSVHSVQSV